jgi:hypothetical protein
MRHCDDFSASALLSSVARRPVQGRRGSYQKPTQAPMQKVSRPEADPGPTQRWWCLPNPDSESEDCFDSSRCRIRRL